MYTKYVEIRNSKHMSDADVSKATGIPPSTFTAWKQGLSSPKLNKLLKIAKLFEVHLEDLLEEE